MLVIDDVTTTGATLHACFRSLEESGALEVAGLALLRSLEGPAQATKGINARRLSG